MPRGRRSGYNDDQQLSFEALWAEPEPARDEQVRPHGDTVLGEDRPGPLPADPGERPGDVLHRAGRAGGDGDPAAPGPAGGPGPGSGPVCGRAPDGRRGAEHHLRDRRDRELELLRASHEVRLRQPQRVGLDHADPRDPGAPRVGIAVQRWRLRPVVRIVVGALAAIGALLSIPASPLWSIAIFALSLWIIYGLVIYGEPEPTPASGPSADALPTAAAGPRPPA